MAKFIDSRELSTKIISFDPRDKNSRPIAPEPQKQSKTVRSKNLIFFFTKKLSKILKIVSFALSEVGLIKLSLGVKSFFL